MFDIFVFQDFIVVNKEDKQSGSPIVFRNQWIEVIRSKYVQGYSRPENRE